jgi:D-alanyl-D-alanine carboxypeptidase (penicillin-binding protein 5/6)
VNNLKWHRLGVVNLIKKFFLVLLISLLLLNNLAFGLNGYEDKIKSYLLADFETGEILESYNIDTTLELASTSKLLSYYVIMDEISKGNISYSDIIVIDEDTSKVTGSSYKLKPGEEFTVEKLLKAAIVISGNDAVYALAKHIAGTEGNFIKLMKNKADNLGLKNCELYNSSGLPINKEGLQNKMTTRELFILVKNLLEDYPEVLEYSKLPFISEPSRNFLEMNTNPLLRTVENVDGLKTGFTGKAGYCLVSTIGIKGEPRKTEDIRLIGIVMGAGNFDDRTAVSKALMEYGKNNYSKRIILHDELPLQTIEFKIGEPKNIDIYPEVTLSKFLNNNTDIKLDIKLSDTKLPLKENTNLGQVIVLENDVPVFTTNIINKQKVGKVNLINLVYRFYASLYSMQEAIFKSL